MKMDTIIYQMKGVKALLEPEAFAPNKLVIILTSY